MNPQTYLLTLREVADELRTSVDTVRRRIWDGQLAYHRIGGQIRVSRKDLQDYLRRTHKAANPYKKPVAAL